MELKHNSDAGHTHRYLLLIVPYGIETEHRLKTVIGKNLLIVPYGIETSDTNNKQQMLILLIVPYGIETSLLISGSSLLLTFNRTLWN